MKSRIVGKLDSFILGCLASGRYRAMPSGEVFDAVRARVVPSRETDAKKPYLRCTLMPSDGRRGKEVMVHRVIALASRGKPAVGLDCDHRDGDKFNNRPGNLEFVKRAENQVRAYRTGLRKPAAHIGRVGAAHHRAKLSEAQAVSLREKYICGMTQYALAAAYGISQPAVSLLVRGVNWKHLRHAA